ncbi:uncharacterized protein LOC106137769 isoform X2 [Amyelois transitella]|uniref:uncharacterized protein LOC106137769 isoform X2 n=1 Tax=Amyelois transitella TaxID=680683 RepID=UPI00298F7644|nr:uncharacterized protein LOC106137769 isoform X2 [Amyelois transitella]
MWRQFSFILLLVVATLAIKVPVDNVETPSESKNDTQNSPVYYTSEDSEIDSYLVPPDPHKPEEEEESDIITPATYLLPPSPEKQTNYYYTPIESGDQSDWLPISAQPQAVPEGIQKVRVGKLVNKGKVAVPIPSDHLEPPVLNAPNDYIVPTPSEKLELPLKNQKQQFVPDPDYPQMLNVNHKYTPALTKDVPIFIRIPKEQFISSQLLPPKPGPGKFKNPTKLYPKKYPGAFKPVPIPIGQFAEDGLSQVPRAKPIKYFQPIPIDEINYMIPSEEKKRYLYEQAELKRKLKEEEAAKSPAVETYGNTDTTEQETSATLHRYPARPAPLRQAPAPAPPSQNEAGPPPSDDRTEFRMHGMKGPHSYQFGYDTGKGKNRQFRYEERDNDGTVRGHYGYMDKRGKLRVVNYRAHPEHGFQADAPVEKE